MKRLAFKPQRVPRKMVITTTVPVLPKTAARTDGGREFLIKDATRAIAVLTVAFFVVADHLNLASILVFSAVVALALTIAREHQRTVRERRLFERQLYDAALKLSEKNLSLKEMVQIDPLTQLLNRRGLEKALSIELSRKRRKGVRLFAALIDCDDFKQVNEKHGHAGGDIALQTVASSIAESVRPTDYTCRVGGDEFIVLLVDLDGKGAAAVAERIRETINSAGACHDGKEIGCTVSIGVAELGAEVNSIEDILCLTRSALQSSKIQGKNRISFAEPRTYSASA